MLPTRPVKLPGPRAAGWWSATLLAVASIACGSTRESGAEIEVVATGLEVPWSMAVAPDGRVFVTERAGTIRVISGDTLVSEPWATVPVYDGTVRNFEAGLMGLALDPEFTREPHVYVCFTVANDTGPQVNRVGRLRESGGRGQAMQVLIDAIPAGRYHNGCRITFGPDGKLYVSTGDAYVEDLAQNPSSLAGKILRINPDGSIPVDNPVPGSPVWALGLRNAQAMAFEPATGRLVLVEHGTGDVDEVNIVQRGGNYGWPAIRGIGADQRFIEPVFVFHAGPASAAFLTGRGGLSGLVVATLSGKRLMRLGVDGDSVWIADDNLLSGFGRLREVIESPDGSLLVATSNRDGRGNPAPDDDRILRVRIGHQAAERALSNEADCNTTLLGSADSHTKCNKASGDLAAVLQPSLLQDAIQGTRGKVIIARAKAVPWLHRRNGRISTRGTESSETKSTCALEPSLVRHRRGEYRGQGSG